MGIPSFACVGSSSGAATAPLNGIAAEANREVLTKSRREIRFFIVSLHHLGQKVELLAILCVFFRSNAEGPFFVTVQVAQARAAGAGTARPRLGSPINMTRGRAVPAPAGHRSQVNSYTGGSSVRQAQSCCWRAAASLSSSAKATHEASGVSGRRLPGRLLSLALRAICDLKNPRGPPRLALGSRRRLVVAPGLKLGPFTFGWAENRRFRCLVPISLYRRDRPQASLGSHQEKSPRTQLQFQPVDDPCDRVLEPRTAPPRPTVHRWCNDGVPQVLRHGAVGLPGIGGGWSLEVLMLRDGQTRGPGWAAGDVWESCEPFYGTRAGPGWYQSGTGVARGCKLPFPVLRMLIQANRKLPQSHLQARHMRGT